MIKFYKNYFVSEDERGRFVGLINDKNWQEINYFYTKENQIRANHYHKKTDELFIILEGKIKITLTRVLPNGKLDNNSSDYSISKNDVFVIEKMTYHTFEIIEESTWINALSIKMDNDNPDIISIKN